MVGLIRNTSGSIKLFGEDIFPTLVSLNVGYMPQDGRALNNLTVGEALYFLSISLSLNPLLLLAIPLCAIPLAGIGALIAAYTRSPEGAGAISLFVTVGLLAVGPVVIPPERLPSFMLLLGYLSPATYAASALRQTLLGPVNSQLFLDLAVLIGLSLAIF